MTDDRRGSFDYCLRIRVLQSGGYTGLSQKTSIEDLAVRCRVEDANRIGTPMEVGANLSKEQSPAEGSTEQLRMLKVPYRQLLGSLLYISEVTRGDISAAINVLSRFSNNPGSTHWKALKRVLIYLYHTRDRVLCFGAKQVDFHNPEVVKNCDPIEVFVDADHAGCKDTARSTSGTLIKLFGDTILAKAKRQGKVSNSTAMAELHSAANVVRKIDFYREVLYEMSDYYQKTIPIYTDSQVVIKMIEKGHLSNATKHLRISFNEIKEKVDDKEISLFHIPGAENPSDILTKPLPRVTHNKHMDTVLNDSSFVNETAMVVFELCNPNGY